MMTSSTSTDTFPSPAHPGEPYTVDHGDGLVVFLIGARVNKWWQIPIVWAVARSMGKMLRELRNDPSSGLLGFESFGGRTTLSVQYWRSLEQLHAYAHDRQRAHVPAWRRWIQSWAGTGAMGIWHETYVATPGNYESLYHHMPPFGLGKIFPRVGARGPLKTAQGRLAAHRDVVPVASRAV